MKIVQEISGLLHPHYIVNVFLATCFYILKVPTTSQHLLTCCCCLYVLTSSLLADHSAILCGVVWRLWLGVARVWASHLPRLCCCPQEPQTTSSQGLPSHHLHLRKSSQHLPLPEVSTNTHHSTLHTRDVTLLLCVSCCRCRLNPPLGFLYILLCFIHMVFLPEPAYKACILQYYFTTHNAH